jgi:hypothetical protein
VIGICARLVLYNLLPWAAEVFFRKEAIGSIEVHIEQHLVSILELAMN